MGVLPHLAQHLRDGILCAPFGRKVMANRGAFFIVVRSDTLARDAVKAFVAWLWSEVRRDGDPMLALRRAGSRLSRRAASGARAQAGRRS
jgi:hypothetical protein